MSPVPRLRPYLYRILRSRVSQSLLHMKQYNQLLSSLRGRIVHQIHWLSLYNLLFHGTW